MLLHGPLQLLSTEAQPGARFLPHAPYLQDLLDGL
jgi:hypothetical protein